MVIINGEEQNAAGLTVAEVLARGDYNAARVAVEKNGLLVPKREFGGAVVSDGDVLEIVAFFGGG
ncbi:MAG: sulfur carrier protein ThiS [Oscillospiraceae bacterium]|nr:sulfur carrier protein ThiS [Oscillospiraceae bacterium]